MTGSTIVTAILAQPPHAPVEGLGGDRPSSYIQSQYQDRFSSHIDSKKRVDRKAGSALPATAKMSIDSLLQYKICYGIGDLVAREQPVRQAPSL